MYTLCMASRTSKTLLSILLLITLVIGGWVGAQSANQRPVVYVAQVEGTIDLGLAPFIERVLQQAQDNNAAAVVLQINTFGGRVDAAVQIRDALLKSPIQSIAFVDTRAISAGALISLAANAIVMAPGGTIGAATPVQSTGTETKPTSEKTISYVRKEFSATAESRGRDTLVAEAMVDPDVSIPGVTARGKLLTLTTEEALKLNIADFEASTLRSALDQLGLKEAEIRETGTNWAEEFVRFLTNPVVSSLLVSIAMIGIIVEVRTPGFGVPGALGLSSLGLFLWGHWLVNLAGWEEFLLAAAGIVLLLIEAFVIPGFGVAGVLGILALLGGLMLSTVGEGATMDALIGAASRLGISLIVAIVASLVILRYLPKTRVGRHLVLHTDLTAESGFTSEPLAEHALVGKIGVAVSTLRPAGIADIEGKRVDVVSDGEFIEPGQPIRVDHVDGNRVVVRHVVDSQ
ncbi:NfeD family protein [Orrella daihaiensis]|uniref:Nodulation protein NfeD n=1 Tax=Orrella daihaiensis TaxID=2782176 RepID=A0ABY4ASB4_9BURK|nr:NfeD family protein [Orrella daihaiensis]UOD50929.1 nodulation protein NfeD [Orrella daihaiensis]